MVSLGWIAKIRSDYAQLDFELRFFGVSSLKRWAVIWDRGGVSYRQSKRFETLF
jgi:hypothetical protein